MYCTLCICCLLNNFQAFNIFHLSEYFTYMYMGQNRNHMSMGGSDNRRSTVCSQLNCSCYSYPSKPRLQWLQVFRLHIYGISKWLLTQLTHAHTATVRVSPHVHSTCTGYVLYTYLYCVYTLVGGAISIRDPYICTVHESVPTNRTLSSTGPLSVQ